MKKNILKLQMLVLTDIDYFTGLSSEEILNLDKAKRKEITQRSFVDLYLKASSIVGYYTSEASGYTHHHITLFLAGKSITVKHDKDLMDFLVLEFKN